MLNFFISSSSLFIISFSFIDKIFFLDNYKRNESIMEKFLLQRTHIFSVRASLFFRIIYIFLKLHFILFMGFLTIPILLVAMGFIMYIRDFSLST